MTIFFALGCLIYSKSVHRIWHHISNFRYPLLSLKSWCYVCILHARNSCSSYMLTFGWNWGCQYKKFHLATWLKCQISNHGSDRVPSLSCMHYVTYSRTTFIPIISTCIPILWLKHIQHPTSLDMKDFLYCCCLRLHFSLCFAVLCALLITCMNGWMDIYNWNLCIPVFCDR